MDFIKDLLKWLLVFSIIIFVFIVYAEMSMKDREQNQKTQRLENSDERKREAIAEQLSNKYDIPAEGNCIYRFQTSGQQGKTLLISVCRTMAGRKSNAAIRDQVKDILSGYGSAIKDAGFETVEISQPDGTIDKATIQ